MTDEALIAFLSLEIFLFIMNLIQLRSLFLLHLLLLLHIENGAAKSIIKILPGFKGDLPFKLETGYIGVGENEEVQLFYYFIESENDPRTDPLLLVLSGGPGCTGLFSLALETGPFTFVPYDSDGNPPTLVLNPYSWTKVANIIYIDSPVGTGYSYANTSQGYASSDSKAAKDNYTFLTKWLLDHPMFIENPLYIWGESYGGKFAPMLVTEIIRGNEAGQLPPMSLQGYFIANGLTDPKIDYNARIPYAHSMALISTEYFEFARISCGEKYYNRDPNNLQCQHALQLIEQCTEHINLVNILNPACDYDGAKQYIFGWNRIFLQDDSNNHLALPVAKQECNDDVYTPMHDWANDPIVQEALHVRKGTITSWLYCNDTLSYDSDEESVFKYHKFVSKKGYRVLIYNGDHDLAAPYIGPLKWIPSLNLSVVENWRPWFVNGQVAGYTTKHVKNDFSLTFATIKGAGHTSATYKPEQCLAIFRRWISGQPI